MIGRILSFSSGPFLGDIRSFCRVVGYLRIINLPETNIAPSKKDRSSQNEHSSSNHPFSAKMLVFREGMLRIPRLRLIKPKGFSFGV